MLHLKRLPLHVGLQGNLLDLWTLSPLHPYPLPPHPPLFQVPLRSLEALGLPAVHPALSGLLSFLHLNSHPACPYTLPFAEALQGFSEFSPKALVALLTLSTLSTVTIGVLMVPYMVTSERPVKTRRKGYEIKRAKVLAERREAENGGETPHRMGTQALRKLSITIYGG